jgi:hypothetical protein
MRISLSSAHHRLRRTVVTPQETQEVARELRALYPALGSLVEEALGAVIDRVQLLRVPSGTPMFGSVREIVTRMLRSFADHGLVRLSRGSVEVLDAGGLRRVAEGI